MRGPLCLIVNPSAGGGRTARALGSVQAELARLGLRQRTVLTTSIKHADELTREAVAAGEIAVSFGGDGMAGAVAHALRDGGGVLGVLPGGRGNDFARKLGIPADPVAACAVLAEGVERRLDVAEVDGRTFVGIASYGFDSAVQDIALDARLVKGQAVYLYATLRALARWKPTELRFVADGGAERTVTGYGVAACNSGIFGGGMLLAPDASLEDGLLDVVITNRAGKLRLLRNLPKLFKGTHVEDPNIEVFRARELRVDAEHPFRIYADGDPIGHTPATIRAVPGALTALVPG